MNELILFVRQKKNEQQRQNNYKNDLVILSLVIFVRLPTTSRPDGGLFDLVKSSGLILNI